MQEAKSTIAVVDDDPSVRKALNRLIRAAGYRTVTYDSAEAFLEANAVHEVDFLILDVHLPGMNGFELQRHLLRTGYHCPLVFISAFSDENAWSQAVKDGALDFLPKPLDSQRLLNVISKALVAQGTDTPEHQRSANDESSPFP